MNTVRIGTRDSPLAVWQANQIKSFLDQKGKKNEIVFVKTKGDIDLASPLHTLGSVGVFTKALDDALLNDQIDVAVHSCKDYPTLPVHDLKIAAYLKRGNNSDLLISKNPLDQQTLESEKCIIATGSIRRKSQWKNKYPHHSIENLRGNVNTRLRKIKEENWHGGIMAEAGLERLKIYPEHFFKLDWMLPAPAQGVVINVVRSKDEELAKLLLELNHKETMITSIIERSFLRKLEGGCSAPIGALAKVSGDEIIFEGILLNIEGSKKCEIEKKQKIDSNWMNFGNIYAEEIISSGGEEILKEIRNGE